MDNRKFGGLSGESNLDYFEGSKRLDMSRQALDHLPQEETFEEYDEFKTPSKESPSWLQHIEDGQGLEVEEPDMSLLIQQGGNVVYALVKKVGNIYRSGVNLLQIEADEVVNDFVMNGNTMWRVALHIPKEQRRADVFVAVPIINGQFEPPESFMDNSGNKYPLTSEGMGDYMDRKHSDSHPIKPSISEVETFPWEKNKFAFPPGEGSAGFLSVGKLEKHLGEKLGYVPELEVEGEDEDTVYVRARLKTGSIRRYAVSDTIEEISSGPSYSFIKRVGEMESAMQNVLYIEDYLGDMHQVSKVYGVKEVYDLEEWISLINHEGVDPKSAIGLYVRNAPCMVETEDDSYNVEDIRTVMSND